MTDGVRVMKCWVRLFLAAALLAIGLEGADAESAPVELRILAINDFHGNLRPPPGGIGIADPDDKTKKVAVSAGGAEHMATLVGQLRARARNTIFVAAGDLIGASPLLSAMFHDEPTIESLSMMGLEVASVGNHEFEHLHLPLADQSRCVRRPVGFDGGSLTHGWPPLAVAGLSARI